MNPIVATTERKSDNRPFFIIHFMLSTNRGMQLICVLILFSLLLKVENSSANRDQKQHGLDLIHEQLGFLIDENQYQNHEIAILKEMVGIQGKIGQPIEQQNHQHQQPKMDEMTRHHFSSEIVRRTKRPARLLPARILYGDRKNRTDPIASLSKFYGPPTNCSDLARLGYTLNGFYTVTLASGEVDLETISDTTKLETIYCSFKQPEGALNPSSAVEKRILHFKLAGNDYTSSKGGSPSGTGIHFQVYKTHYKELSGEQREQMISFNSGVLNLGNTFVTTMKNPKGKFIAPKAGVYQFLFTSVMGSIPKNVTSIVINLIQRTAKLAGGLKTDDDSLIGEVVGRSSTKEANNTMAIAATLSLNKGDQIFLVTQQGRGYKIDFASFSCSLLQVV